jgi:hypothetical protein
MVRVEYGQHVGRSARPELIGIRSQYDYRLIGTNVRQLLELKGVKTAGTEG